jgi:hypothetical protein
VTDVLGWRWIFAVNLLVLGPAIALASRLVDPGPPASAAASTSSGRRSC